LNKLHFGDNLEVLRKMPTESVDLIYLDPPFNSKADYGVIYGTRRGGPSQAQAHAFKDMWTWGQDARDALNQTAERHLEAGVLLDSFQKVFPDSNMLAYLAMMGVRLIEMHRVLKPTGSLYIHCDPTASHYLKILLDSVFGLRAFKNEVIWKRTSAHSAAGRWADVHDVLLFYTKSDSYTWNKQLTDYDDQYKERYKNVDGQGRRWADDNLTAPGKRGGDSGGEWRGFNPTKKGLHWKVSHNAVVELIGEQTACELSTRQKLDVLDKNGLIHWPRGTGFPRFKRVLGKGRPLQDIILDIPPLNSQAQERLGYSTQKPLALLKRILEASSNPGDIVLDPFCGCGTAVEAAEELHREWVGIDVTYLAIHVIEGRLTRAFGPGIKQRYQLFGRPRDANDARALAARDWLEFQKWAVFALGGLPKDKPGADGGIDGIIRYHRVGIEQPNRAVVSIKGGAHVGVDAIHKLKSVVQREKAEFGVLVCLDGPTRAMEKEILSEGEVGPPSRRVPK
jgi:DNA modification methylase